MEKKFYQYAHTGTYPTVNEVIYPHCPIWGDDPEVFLVYAENEHEAFKLAMEHIYDHRPLTKYFGTYKGQGYYGSVKCVM